MGEVVNEMTPLKGNPLVPQTNEVFIVVPMHARGMTGAAQWDGPFETRELAQQAAAMYLMRTGALTVSVFQLIGTVAKPVPDLQWHEPEKK